MLNPKPQTLNPRLTPMRGLSHHRAIPPLLLMWYNYIGRGATLRMMCRLCFYLSALCGILALVLLWLVYPREVNPTP